MVAVPEMIRPQPEPAPKDGLPDLRFHTHQAAEIGRFGKNLVLAMAPDAPDCAVKGLTRGERQPVEMLAQAGAKQIVDAYQRHGLGVTEGGWLVPRFQAALVDGLVLFSDLDRLPRDIRRDPALAEYVDPLWEGPSIANLISPTRCGSALDMGCGCGVLALTLARHSDRVIATDVNPRALRQTRFNALLNGVTNIDVRASDLFSALQDERFDRIAFNAPVGMEFRPSNFLEAGEEILQSFFQQVDTHLTTSGRCWVNICAKDYARSAAFDRLRSWMGSQADNYRLLYLEQWRIQAGLKFRARQLAARLFFPHYGALQSIQRGMLCMAKAPKGRWTAYRTPYFDWTRALGRQASGAFVDWALANPPGQLDGRIPEPAESLPEPGDLAGRTLLQEVVAGYVKTAAPIPQRSPA